MAYEIKGNVEIQHGLGLPRKTTAQRLAYTPPNVGYKVFDTDIGAEFLWDGLIWDALSTQEYVDDTYLSLDGGNVTGNISIQNPSANSVLVLDGPTGIGSGQVLFRRGGVTEGDVFSVSNRLLIRRNHSGAGSSTNLEMFDDYLHVNKEFRGQDGDGSRTDTFTTKGYVDDNFLGITGGSVTGNLTVDQASSHAFVKLDAGPSNNSYLEFLQDGTRTAIISAFATSTVISRDSGAAFTLRDTNASFSHNVNVDGDIAVGDATATNVNPKIVINSPTTGNPYVEFERDSVRTGQITGLDNRLQLEHTSSSLSSTLSLYNDVIVSNVPVRGVSDAHPDSFITVDQAETDFVTVTSSQSIAGNKTFTGNTTLFGSSNEMKLSTNDTIRQDSTGILIQSFLQDVNLRKGNSNNPGSGIGVGSTINLTTYDNSGLIRDQLLLGSSFAGDDFLVEIGGVAVFKHNANTDITYTDTKIESSVALISSDPVGTLTTKGYVDDNENVVQQPAAYEMVMPTAAPTVGQTLEVDTVVGTVVTMKWV